jgi:hypothetical protein
VREPICLIRWLAREGVSEVEKIASEAQSSVNLFWRPATEPSEVLSYLEEWGKGNDNSQCAYVAAHGLEDENQEFIGIYDGVESSKWLSWLQLGETLARLEHTPVAWLGACGSAAAMPVWSEHILPTYLPATWAIAFEEGVHYAVIEATLRKAIANMNLDPIAFLERELPLLREDAGQAVKMFYPAYTRDTKRSEYVDVDVFSERVGVDFQYFLSHSR